MMDPFWGIFIFLVLSTAAVLWHEFRFKKSGWTKVNYQVYILVLMFLSFVGYGMIVYFFG